MRWLCRFFSECHFFCCCHGGLPEHAPNPLFVFLNVIPGKCATVDEEFGVLSKRGWLFLGRLVHSGLGEAPLVSLVMSIATVADNVDDNVFLVFGTVICGELAYKVEGFHVVPIDVEDGCTDGFDDIEWVWGVERGTWNRGLVDGSSSAIGKEVVETHCLLDDTLTGKKSL